MLVHKIENSFISMEIPYFQTPNSIFDYEIKLSIYAKITYIYLCRCSNQGSAAFPSYKTIGEKCGMSRRKSIDAVNELIEINLLYKEVRKSDGKNMNISNIYIVKLPSAQCAPPKKENIVHNMHHPSAQCAPNKELIKKNYNKEEEEVISAYENSKVSKVTKTEKNKLLELHTKYPKDLILKAIDYMSDHADKPNIAYIRTTLEDWTNKGLTTLDEVNKCLEAWESTKQKAKENKQNNIKKQTEVKKEVKVDTFNNYKQREYDFEDLERKLRFGEREG